MSVSVCVLLHTLTKFSMSSPRNVGVPDYFQGNDADACYEIVENCRTVVFNKSLQACDVVEPPFKLS